MIRTDRENSNGGGTAILIKENVKFETLVTNLTSASLEYTGIKVILENNKFLYIFSIYNNNQYNHTLNLDLQNLLNCVNTARDQFIIGGDFNSKHINWKNNSNNFNGIQLNNFICAKWNILKHCYSFLPTYVAGNRRSFLDYFLISNSLTVQYPHSSFNFLKTHEFESDHKAVELFIHMSTKIENNDNIN